MSERGVRLRVALVDAARDEQIATLESRGVYLGEHIAWDDDMTKNGAAAGVARAICEHLGIDHAMARSVRWYGCGEPSCDDDCSRCDTAADALSALLEAAGIEDETDT